MTKVTGIKKSLTLESEVREEINPNVG